MVKQPNFDFAHTNLGRVFEFMVNSHKWHGVAPNDEQLQKAIIHPEEVHDGY
ncbi:transketolase [Flammeovirgaceae bacterium 311]|nr:transketolase [Flammeovirgaceae bacterium 311]